MASEYLNKQYPDVKGFSPRSLRRMRDFYRTYENHSALLSRAMKLGWIQNVVIMEADLIMDLREWYMKAAEQFGWSKTELIANIAANAHENVVLAIEKEMCYIVEQEEKQTETDSDASVDFVKKIHQTVQRIRKWWLIWKGVGDDGALCYGRYPWRNGPLSCDVRENSLIRRRYTDSSG